MPNAYRVFIALPLPPPVREHMAGVQSCLAGQGLRARWVRSESMHLTLKFLGALVPEKVATVVGALDPVAAAGRPLALATAGLGVFPNLRRARVVWLGVGGGRHHLTALQQAVDAALAPLGWPPEKRSFKGHLTLARAKGRGLFARSIADQLSLCEPADRVPFQADRMVLYRSRLEPRGAIYDKLHQWHL